MTLSAVSAHVVTSPVNRIRTLTVKPCNACNVSVTAVSVCIAPTFVVKTWDRVVYCIDCFTCFAVKCGKVFVTVQYVAVLIYIADGIVIGISDFINTACFRNVFAHTVN